MELHCYHHHWKKKQEHVLVMMGLVNCHGGDHILSRSDHPLVASMGYRLFESLCMYGFSISSIREE